MPIHMPEETLLKFPCDFPIKAVGRAHPEFLTKVVTIVENHVSYVPKQAVKSARSRNGNYLSVTVLITANSKRQLDNIYHDLTGCEDVIMAS